MRPALLTAALMTFGIAAADATQAADLYAPPPVYRAPPRVHRPPPPVAHVAPPPVAYAAPVVVHPPAGVIAAPEGPAYLVQQPAYQPGDEYVQAPFLVDGRRYARACWFEHGQRVCTLH